jgi:hypothetical protein
MRKAIYLLFALISISFLAEESPAQDAGKVFDQYIQAAGGSKTLSKLQTISIDGTFSAGPDSKPGTYALRIKQPNRYYSEIRSEGKTLIESYNGKSAWHQIETGENSTLLGPQALETEAAGQYYNARFQNSQKRKSARP